MIDLAGTIISSMTFGSEPIVAIWFGDTKVWPTGVITTAITSVGLHYSSGNIINAAGSNYAFIQGTLITYVDGTENSRRTVYLNPSFASSSIWYNEGDFIRANSRGTITGGTRSITVAALYQGRNYGSFSVQQAANTVFYYSGAITAFALDGNSARTQSISYEAKTLYVTDLSGYRRSVYSSGAELQTRATLALKLDDNNNWATVNGTSSVYFPKNTGETRSATITAYDVNYYPTVSSSITVTQGSEVAWVLEVPSRIDIPHSTTAFTIGTVVSTADGEPYPITSEMISISPNASNITIVNFLHLGQGRYVISCRCNENTGKGERNSYVTISQPGGKSATCRIVQSANLDAISGITISDDAGDWVIGTVTVGSGTTAGVGTWKTRAIVVAKTTPITSDATVSISNFAWQWAPPVSGANINSYNETNVSFVVEAGSTLTFIPLGFDEEKTYYGAYVQSPSQGALSPKPNMQINRVSGFSVSE